MKQPIKQITETLSHCTERPRATAPVNWWPNWYTTHQINLIGLIGTCVILPWGPTTQAFTAILMWTISAKKVAPETTLLRFESKNNIKLIYGSEYWKFQRAQIWEFGVSCWRRLRQAPFCVSYDIPASHQDVTVCATTTRHNSWLHAIKTVRTLISDVPLVESSSKCWHSAHAVQEQQKSMSQA